MAESAEFEKATRLKIRFRVNGGVLMVEDLWHLPLTSKTGRANLDDIARSLHERLTSNNISFVEETKKDEEAEVAFGIVKHVIHVKLDENKKANEARERAEQKQKIMKRIAEIDDEALLSKGREELMAELAKLAEV